MATPRPRVPRNIIIAIRETVKETPTGAPGDAMYAALQAHITPTQFTATMTFLVHAGWVRKEGETYYPGPNYETSYR